MPPKPATVDGYLATLPSASVPIIEQLRGILRKAVPKGTECLSYGILAIEVDGRKVVYFNGYAQHVSIYPVPSGDADLIKALLPYRAGKGTLRFALDTELPVVLITKAVKQLAKEAAERAVKTKKR